MAVEPQLVEIPAGTFTLGQPLCPQDVGDVEVPHPWHTKHGVAVARFRLGRYPVTNVEYRAYLEVSAASAPSHIDVAGFNDPQQPVVGISWQDADAYARWLAQTTGKQYRLPGDVEWEYAARGGRDGTLYPWGDDLAPQHLSYNLQPQPPKVGLFPANGFGLHDMVGTVWEWCAELFNDCGTRTRAFNTPTNGDPAVNRVLRGGSYVTSKPLHLCIAYRHEDPPDLRHPVIGFRLACDAA